MTTLHFTPRVQRRANLAFSGVPPKCRGAAAHQPGKNPLGTDIQSDGNEQTGNPALWPTQSTCPPVWLPEASTACGRPLPLLLNQAYRQPYCLAVQSLRTERIP